MDFSNILIVSIPTNIAHNSAVTFDISTFSESISSEKSKTPLSILDPTSANFQILKKNVHRLSETDPKFEV